MRRKSFHSSPINPPSHASDVATRIGMAVKA
jgi:hypothetical protein